MLSRRRILAILSMTISFTAGAEELALTPQAPLELFDELAENPIRIASGDLNGDGIVDAVVIDADSDKAITLIGTGGGKFVTGPGSPHELGVFPVDVLVTDFNADGFLDCAVANVFSNDVTVLLGDGTGNLEASADSPYAVGDRPVSMDAADVDNDGNIDLVSGSASSNDVSILIGDGAGAFALASSIANPNANPISAIALAELTGDNSTDLVIANRNSGEVSILEGNGNGGFASVPGSPFAVENPFGPDVNIQDIAVADVNDDGAQDLVLPNDRSSVVTILEGDGAGGFAEAAAGPVSFVANPNSVALFDVNADGNLDILANSGSIGASRASSTVGLALGDGSGKFTKADDSPFETSGLASQFAVGDVDGDGRHDLLVAHSRSDDLSILLNDSAGGFQEPTESNFIFGTDPVDVAVGNLDGDQHLDVVVARGARADLALLQGDGSGGLSSLGQPIKVAAGLTFVDIGDLDKNGIQDLVTANPISQTLSVLLGSGNGAFSPVPQSPIDIGAFAVAVARADVNGDGQVDLVTANRFRAGATILPGDGNGSFSESVGSPIAIDGTVSDVAVADFDKDGNPDIALLNRAEDGVNIFLNDGDGSFSEVSSSPFPVGDFPVSIAVGDSNGDGNQDLLAANRVPNSVTVLEGDGNGNFSESDDSPIATGSTISEIDVLDIDEDGALDVVIANENLSSLSVFLGDGIGGFTQSNGGPLSVADGPIAIAAGDMDGDGSPDLISVHDNREEGGEKISVVTSDVLFADDLEEASLD